MSKRRRRKLDKCIVRKVLVIVGGRTVRTVRHRLTMAAAVREMGRDPVAAEGRLLSTAPVTFRRKLCRGVAVQLVYQWDGKYKPHVSATPALTPLADVRTVIRADLAG